MRALSMPARGVIAPEAGRGSPWAARPEDGCLARGIGMAPRLAAGGLRRTGGFAGVRARPTLSPSLAAGVDTPVVGRATERRRPPRPAIRPVRGASAGFYGGAAGSGPSDAPPAAIPSIRHHRAGTQGGSP